MALSQKNTGGTASKSAAPAKAPSFVEGFGNRFRGVSDWFRSIASELRKVTWPSRETVRNLTIIVVAVSATVGALLGVIDYLFKLLFEQLLR